MQPALVVRFRPTGPWRTGSPWGVRHAVDPVFHSDSFFSALTHAMAQLGRLEEWLAATVGRAEGPAVTLSSCFPYLDEVHFVAPPETLWPPPPSAKVPWEAAQFVPLSLVSELVGQQPFREDAWKLDGPSGCLMPLDFRFTAPGPFRVVRRRRAAVDRLGCGVQPHETACLEFADSGGFWAVVGFADEAAYQQWADPVRGALRWLADTGMGGERSQGWGHSEAPEFIEAELPGTILPPAPDEPAETAAEGAYWLLSLYVPAADDPIDWERSRFSLLTRGGRVESSQGWGYPKKLLRMIKEGSVLSCSRPLRGAAPDVAPEGFPHPVYRSGLALAVRIAAAPGERTANSDRSAGTP